jgi:hypothetical protein
MVFSEAFPVTGSWYMATGGAPSVFVGQILATTRMLPQAAAAVELTVVDTFVEIVLSDDTDDVDDMVESSIISQVTARRKPTEQKNEQKSTLANLKN